MVLIFIAGSVSAVGQRGLGAAILRAVFGILLIITIAIPANRRTNTLAEIAIKCLARGASLGQAGITHRLNLAATKLPIEVFPRSASYFNATDAAIIGASAFFPLVASAVATVPTNEDTAIRGAGIGVFPIFCITGAITTLAEDLWGESIGCSKDLETGYHQNQ